MAEGFWARLARHRRERRLARHAFDDAIWQTVVEGLPFLARLNAQERRQLRELATLFAADKAFSTAHDLPLTDAMRVCVAAQACLPVLKLGLAFYRGWHGIILYPGEFVIRKQVQDEAGVVHDVRQEASGEAWEGGPVILSWQDARPGGSQAIENGPDIAPEPFAYNVVIHEFAHKIDMLDGEADGIPPLLRRLHGDLTRDAWCAVFDDAYARFCERVAAVPDHRFEAFARRSLIDVYATEHESEFFAVCAEAFFVTPQAFATEYPALYRLFCRYFLQNPAQHTAAYA